jgi:capsular polysaccharide transport system permease protein
MILYFEEPIILRFDYTVMATGLAAYVGLAVGLLNCIMFAFSNTWQTVFGLLNRPMFMISGIFFLYEDLPGNIQEILWWNPFLHITSLMRRGFYYTYEGNFVSIMYVITCGTVPLLIGVMLMRALRGVLLEEQ